MSRSCNTFEIKCLSVLCGDAILVRFRGNDGNRHNVLIDGGYVKTYRNVLKPVLESIIEKKERISLLIATHYDADHIGGLIALVNDTSINLSALVDEWWINFDLPLTREGGEISIGQLNTLKGAVLRKAPTQLKPITVNLPAQSFYGARFTVLSPDKIRYNSAAVLIANTKISSSNSDYHLAVDELVQRVKKECEEDTSTANGSSIAVLLTKDSSNILLLADSFPSVVSKSIRNMGYSESMPLTVHCLKLSHHGSKGNISNELLSLIQTTRFIISSNGINRHNLPHKEAIVRILVNAKRQSEEFIHLYFTHKNPTLESMFLCDGLDVYNKWRFQIHYPQEYENFIEVI